MPEKPKSVTALNLKQLTDFLKGRELPAYRARQIWKWVWQKGAVDYAAMTDLGKELRERLAAELPVTSLAVTTVRRSAQDGTAKALLTSPAGKHVEAVAMPNEDDEGRDGGHGMRDARCEMRDTAFIPHHGSRISHQPGGGPPCVAR
jgi:hypothetical protein